MRRQRVLKKLQYRPVMSWRLLLLQPYLLLQRQRILKRLQRLSLKSWWLSPLTPHLLRRRSQLKRLRRLSLM